MKSYPAPHLIRFSQFGTAAIGYISVSEQAEPLLPFAVQRVFWTYDTPESIVRGRHAHRHTEQVVIAAAGRLMVTTELVGAATQSFSLEEPNVGLYIPPNAWHTIQYAPAAVQLVLASTPYAEADYIRDYATFREVWRPRP